MFVPFLVATCQFVIMAEPVPAPVSVPAPGDLVKQLANGALKLAGLIEPTRGLLWVDHFVGPSEERRAPVAKRLCGVELGGQRAAIEQRLIDDAKRTLEAREGEITCEAEFGGTTCTVGATMEWDAAVHLVFDKRAATKGAPERYVLRAVFIDDEVLVDEDGVKAARAKLAVAAKKLGTRGCR